MRRFPNWLTVMLAIAASLLLAEVVVWRGKLSLPPSSEQPVDLRSIATAVLSPSSAPARGRSTPWTGPQSFNAAHRPTPSIHSAARHGFGSMTARVPGRTEVVLGVRLTSHVVRTQIRDAIARTEIEEVFENETAQVLEGRYVFPVPPDASISRLALWVGKRLMEGEVLETKRAANIFNSIVEDTVRPRDPALLEWVSPSEVSLKVFPIPAHGTRKVLLAYDQVLPMDDGEASYVYPLSVGEARTEPVDRFELHVAVDENRASAVNLKTPGYAAHIQTDARHAEVHFNAAHFVPEEDFVLRYERKLATSVDVAQFVVTPSAPQSGASTKPDASSTPGVAQQPRASQTQAALAESFFLARLDVDAAQSPLGSTQTALERVFLLDISHSQSKASLQAATEIINALLEGMDPDEHFAVLACDSACRAFPEQGLGSISEKALQTAKRWMNELVPGGSSDLSAALIAGAQRLSARRALQPNAQLIYLGDGAPTAGELSAETIERRIKQTFAAQTIDMRLLGLGSDLDENTLSGLARRLGAAYERVPLDTELGAKIAKLKVELRQPLLKHATLTASPALAELCPKQLPNLVLGQHVLVLGKASTAMPGRLVLSGEVNGAPYSRAFELTFTTQPEDQNPYVSRIWAAARIAEIEEQTPTTANTEAIQLSRRYRVMSRHTAWLVLENNAMYEEFGIRQGAARGPLPPKPSGELETATLGALSSAGPVTTNVLETAAMPKSSVAQQGVRPGAMSSGPGALSLGGSGLSSNAGTGRSVRVAGPRGRVDLGGVALSGGAISNATRVVAGMRAGFRNCYNRELASNPDAQGGIQLYIAVGPGGEVVNATSTHPDSLVATGACVEARARAAQFDPPSGGSATVHVQVTFRVEPTGFFDPPEPNAVPAQPYVPYVEPKNSATHRPGDESWRAEGEGELERLRQATDEAPKSRKAREAFIRALIRRGRSVEALSAARRFVELDPDLPRALELLAYAAATAANRESAVTALDAMVESAPRDSRTHYRAAEAFSAAGDEPRACAHWRSLDELHPGQDSYATEALRCRYRVFGERDTLLVEARAIQKPGPLLEVLLGEFETGHVGPHVASAANVGQFKAAIHCDAPTCPTLLIITPNGSVLSPWTPGVSGSSEHSLVFSGLVSGIYRTLLIGGAAEAQGSVELTALGNTRKFEFSRGGVDQTIAATTVSLVSPDAIEDARRAWWRSRLLPR